MNEKWIAAPIPVRMQSRSEEENQLAQLVRWYLWVQGDVPMSRAHELFDLKRDVFYRGMRDLVLKTVLAISATLYDEFGVELDQNDLERLSVLDPEDEPEWRVVAEQLQDGYMATTSKQEM